MLNSSLEKKGVRSGQSEDMDYAFPDYRIPLTHNGEDGWRLLLHKYIEIEHQRNCTTALANRDDEAIAKYKCSSASSRGGTVRHRLMETGVGEGSIASTHIKMLRLFHGTIFDTFDL